MTQPRRDWSAAREKVEREDSCRVRSNDLGLEIGSLRRCCGPLEAAHIVGREHDKHPPSVALMTGKSAYWVSPDRIVPLCCRHHQMYDAHELDLLGYLTPEEEAQAVLDAGGLENARRRLCPSEYRQASPFRKMEVEQ